MLKKLLPMFLALTALPVGATTVYYVGSAGESAFLDATGSLPFTSGFTLDETNSIGTESGTGLQFLAFTNNNSGAATLTITGGKLAQVTAPQQSTILLDVNSTFYAIGLYVTTLAGFADYCIGPPGETTCSQGDPFQAATVDSSGNVFFGIISDTPITDFQLRRDGGSGGPKLAMVSVGGLTTPLGSGDPGSGDPGGAEAPEPSSMALMGGALIAIPLWARYRLRK